jgi:lysophospholipase L1-like esterase
MRVRLLGGAMALLVCFAAIVSQAGAKSTAPAKATVHYYLALGDSLSVGYQPNSAGHGIETTQGYVNDIYAVAKTKIKDLKLVQLGCPGDTTTSLLTGKGNDASAKEFKCDRKGGSQLKAAEAFLKAHATKGEVPLITLDIGANDVDSCVTDASAGVSAVESCVATGVKTLETNMPKILAGIKKAAPKGTALAAMNLYDPVLADELSTDSSDASLGSLSLDLIPGINTAIAKADTAAGFKTADVAAAFNTYDTTPESTVGTSLASTASSEPTDLVNICDLTWMCAAPPVGPNIHANKQGYSLIAKAFEAVLPKAF